MLWVDIQILRKAINFQAAVEVNRDAVYHLITSHAHFDIQLYLAQKLKGLPFEFCTI